MTRKAMLSKCDTCKQPKPAHAYRRYADTSRHGSCIVCEDEMEAVKKRAMSASKARKYGATNKSPQPPFAGVQTMWLGGKYPGAM